MPRLGDATGQASVELVAVLPLVVLAAGAMWQAVLAGQAVWASAGAARAAARAEAIGADAAERARATLPASLRDGLRVQAGRAGVRVDLSIPLVFTGGHLASVTARAALPPQR
jgi:hypothetical protein